MLLPAGCRLGLVRIEGLIGRGGTGRVYRAWDEERQRPVAVKTLDVGSTCIRRIQNEFRTLTHIAHPNIVPFYELGQHESTHNFTMRLVQGQQFGDDAEPTATTDGADGLEGVGPRDVGDSPRLPSNELERWLLQLCDAVEALHRASLLHLDIKPANLMVDQDGDLVLVDFGLARRLDDGIRSTPAPSEGTPGYCSPEHRAGRPIGTPSDWYGVGATLCKVMTGSTPVTGLLPTTAVASDDIEGRLTRCWIELVDPEPASRANGNRVREILGRGVDVVTGTASANQSASPSRQSFVDGMLALLEDEESGHRIVVLRGAGGAGKSVLLREFLDRLERGDPHTVAFEGLSRERETVPFGLWDDVIGGLVERLGTDAGGVILTALPLLFPHRFDDAEGQALTHPRNLVPAAVQELGRCLDVPETRVRKALVFDDVQWSDPDSAGLMVRLLAEESTPPLLVVLAYRPGSDDPPVVREVRRWLASLPLGVKLIERELEPASDAATVEDATSLGVLSAAALEYLDVLACTYGPTSQAVVRASLADPSVEPDVVAVLRARRIITTRGPRLSDHVDFYHRDYRGTIRGQLDDRRARRIHFQIASQLVRLGTDTPEELARHYSDAGRQELAVIHARAAGDAAARIGAYHRAARFYDSIVRGGMVMGDDRLQLILAQASALAASGRGAASAQAYAEAAAVIEDQDAARRYRLEAAEQLLISGRVELGTELLQGVASETGLVYPSTQIGVVVRTLAGLAHAWLCRDWSGSRDSEASLERARLALVAFRGLMPVDPLRAAYFAIAGIRHAGRGSSAEVTANALINLSSGVLVPAGGRLARWGHELIDRTRAITDELDDPGLTARLLVARSTIAFWGGDWDEARRLAEEGLASLAEVEIIRAFDLNIANLVVSRSLEELGAWDDSARLTGRMFLDAVDRGDRYALATSCLNRGLCSLAHDDPDGARQWSATAIGRWAAPGYHVQHVYAMRVDTYAMLYEGEAERAWSLVQHHWPRIKRGQHLRIPTSRLDLALLRGRIAVALAASDASRSKRWIRHARSQARILAHMERSDSDAHAASILAGCDQVSGRLERSRRGFIDASKSYRALGMRAYELACTACAAESTDQIQSALEALREVGIARPRRWLAIYGPSWNPRSAVE